MVTIPTATLKRFIYHCSDISDTRLLPIYAYVKLVCSNKQSQLIKSNGNRFIVFDIDADFKKEQILMIEAKPLFGFVKFSRTSEITITPNGSTVKISDGEKEISCQLTKDLYPTIPDNSNSEKIDLSKDVLDALSIAKNHTSNEKVLKPWNCYVHIRKIEDKYWVIGTRGEATYFKGFVDKLPEISIDPDVIPILHGHDQLTHSSTEGYDFFETIGVLYGFQRPETKCSEQVDKVLQNFKSPDSFELNKQPIIDFCEMVNAVNELNIPAIVIIEGTAKNEIILRFDDAADNVKAAEPISVENKTFNFKECGFLPRNILTVLKGAQKEKVKISYAHRNFIVTSSEDGYIGAMMELAI